MKHSNRIRQWCRFQRPIVPLAMPLMNLLVIQHRRRWILRWQNILEELGISIEQCVDRLGHLTRYPTDDPLLPNAGLRLFVIRAPRLDQALVQFGPLVVLQADSLEDSKEQDLLHRPGSSACQTGMIQGAAGLDDNWSPTEVRFEGRGRGEVVDRTNGRNNRRCSDGPETWKRQQDLPLASMFDDVSNFTIQLLDVLTQKPKLFDQLALFQHKATKACDILDANTLRSQTLQFQELGIREGTSTASDLLKGRKTDRCKSLGGRKALAERQSEERIRIFHDAGQFGKDLITDGRQLVLPLRALADQLIAVTDQAFELGGGLRWRNNTSDQLQFVGHLDPQFELAVELIRQGQCIPLVCFEHASWTALHMHHIHRDIQLLQILFERAVIVAGALHEYKNVLKWGQAAYPLDEQAEALACIFKHQGGTCFKAFMTLKEGLGEEACQVPPFANVNADVQGFIQQQRNGFQVSTLSGSLCHGSSLRSWRQTHIRTDTRCGWRGLSPWKCRSHRLLRGSSRSPQTYQGFSTLPPLRVKGSVPTMSKGVFRLLSWKSDPQVTSPVQYYTNFYSKSRFQQSMSRVTTGKGRSKMNMGEAASRVVVQVYHSGHTRGSREKLSLCTQPSPAARPRSREPGARAMPSLPGVGERYAPRATWSCIDEPLKPPGRSRSASLPTPGKGRFSRHRLLRAPGMSTVAATPPRLKLPGMLDEPVGSLPLSLWKQFRQPVVPSLGGKEKHPLSVDQGQDERARPRPSHLLRGTESAWSGGSNPHRESGTRWRAAADIGAGQGQGSRSAEGRRGSRVDDSIGAQAPCAGESTRSVQCSPWGATQRCGRLSSGGVWPRRMCMPRCFKGGRLIAGLVHPHAVDDAHPDVGQGAHRHTMRFAFRPFALVIGQRPLLVQRRLPGELVQSVAQWFHAGEAFVRFGILATLERHWSGPGQGLDTGGIGVPRAIIAPFGQQTGSQVLASTGKRPPELVVRMGQKKGADGLVVAGDLLDDDQQLFDQRQHQARLGAHDDLACYQLRTVQFLKDLRRSLGRVGVLAQAQGGRDLRERGSLRGLGRRIRLQEDQRGALLHFGKQLQCDRIVLLEARRQLVHQARLRLDQPILITRERFQFLHERTIGLQAAQFRQLQAPQFGQQMRVNLIGLGSRRFAQVIGRLRIDGIDGDARFHQEGD